MSLSIVIVENAMFEQCFSIPIDDKEVVKLKEMISIDLRINYIILREVHV